MTTPDAHGWMPIETAPRDGEAFLVWHGEGFDEIGFGFWETGEYRAFYFGWDREPAHPRLAKLWQPLPSPPIPTDIGDGASPL